MGRCRGRSIREVVTGVVALALVVVGCANDRSTERVGGNATANAATATTSGTRATTTATTVTTAAPATSTSTTRGGCASPATTLVAGRHTIESSGVEREYLLDLPAPFDPAAPTPVILNFHGSGSNMDQQAIYSGFPTAATARGYLVITPNGTGTPRGWSFAGGADDVLVADLLATVGEGACVDARRIFAAGISNGSAYSALMACRAPYRIAAVGMVAATLPSTCPIDRPIPAVAFHGTADEVVPYDGGAVNSEGANGTEAPGAEGAIARWAERNGCAEPPSVTAYAADVVGTFWGGCADGADVAFYSIAGGGHTWPGGIDLSKSGLARLGATTQSISATTVFLDFFDAHELPER